MHEKKTADVKVWTHKLVDRALDDADYRAQLLDNPKAAIAAVVDQGYKVQVTAAQRARLVEIFARAKHDHAFCAALRRDPVAAVASLHLPPIDGAPLAGIDARYFCFMTFIYVGNPD